MTKLIYTDEIGEKRSLTCQSFKDQPTLRFEKSVCDDVRVFVGDQMAHMTREEIAALAALFPITPRGFDVGSAPR